MVLDDEERLVEGTQRLKPGTSARKWTGVIQGVVALFMLGFGIVLVVLRYDDEYLSLKDDSSYWRFRPVWIANLLDNVASGIWSALIFMITAVVGYCSGRSRSVIALYLALCLFSVFVSMAACGVTVGSISSTSMLKGDASYVCGATYNFRESWCDDSYIMQSNSYHNNGPKPDEWDCEQYFKCKEEIYRKANLQIPFYAFTLVCAVVELICGVLGASFTCVGLCKCPDCCKTGNEQQPQQVVYCGMNANGQLTNLGNMPSNLAYPPPMYVPGMTPVGQVTNQHVNMA